VTLTGRSDYPGNLRIVGFDVDGVFTDGRFYLADDGIETKAFFTQDGFGIRRLLDAGLEVVVISGRQSVAVERRMAEIGIKHVIQGCRDKVAAFDGVLAELGIDSGHAAFVGDDVPDLALLRHVGFAVAVANAVPVVKQECDTTTRAKGGFGAVREVCDGILAARGMA
jgi:3-deoxy-D-manno-octulosonate 8-phosphate phosphatase (KDO 8-P phosphatase)